MKEVDPTDTRGAHDPGVSNGEDTPNFPVLRLFAVSQGCNLDSGKTNQAREGRDGEFKFEYALLKMSFPACHMMAALLAPRLAQDQ